jgi:hypothetical protein
MEGVPRPNKHESPSEPSAGKVQTVYEGAGERWSARPEHPPSREYVDFEIEAARILAEKLNQSLVDVARDYTTLLHGHLWPGTERYIDAEGMSPGELTDALYAREQEEYKDLPSLEYHEDTRYGCFTYHHQIDVPVVDIHFKNAENDEDSPLSKGKMQNRQQELRDMLIEIKREYPETKEIEGKSWLYALDSYRRLFPESYTESREETVATSTRDVSSGSSWGQFIDGKKGLRKDLADQFLANLRALKEVTLEGIRQAFPLKTYRVRGPIADFYAKYGTE